MKLWEEFPHSMIYRQYGPEQQCCGIGFLHFENIGGGRQNHRIPNSYTFAYVASGKIAFTGCDGTERILTPGYIFQRFPGEIQSSEVVSQGDYFEMFFHLDPTVYDAMKRSGMPALTPQTWLAGEDNRLLREAFEMQTLLRRASPAEISLIISRILVVINTLYLKADRGFVQPPLHSVVIEQAARLLEDNVDVSITLEEIAEKVHLGKDTFRKEFKKYTGFSPIAYQIRARINRACKLLEAHNLSIKEVSSLLGYPDVYSFSRQFKQITGKSPSRF